MLRTLFSVAAAAALALQSPAPDPGVGSPLPLIPVPVHSRGELLVVMITGDGGWAPADRALTRELAARGVPVVGLDAPAYLSHMRRPDELAHDVSRVIRYYLRAWERERVVVVGYSRGADLAPFAVARLPEDVRARVALVALLGPGQWAGFEFHLSDLLRDIHRDIDLPVAPEVVALRGTPPVLCISGRKDLGSICPALGAAGVARVVIRDGGHGVAAREGRALADTILAAVGTSRLEH
ncbi:MAG TPA: AcvB/VirJ family lysyl-phosphatidylglycerol hydrolase [Gemmatimonadaceae bacterium]|nr:AcvB/VirJ family lysyl-phosphatidylglycerol hydrolase [Gemmatimonadaceae bacterium]